MNRLHSGAAQMLLAARRQHTQIDRLPVDCRPVDAETGYEIQAQVVAALGGVGGWKIGAGDAEATPLYAPIPLSGIHHDGAILQAAAYPQASVEAEIAFRLRCDLPPRDGGHALAAVAEAVEMIPALEIYSSRYLQPAAAGEAENLADCLANGGLVVGGPAAPSSRGSATPDTTPDTTPSWDIDLSVDGKLERGRGLRHPVGDPLRLVAWLADRLNARGDGLRAGQVVTTGALVLAPLGREVRCDWRGLGSVAAVFT